MLNALTMSFFKSNKFNYMLTSKENRFMFSDSGIIRYYNAKTYQ